jgi:glyceraldehyde-3-phosphate dehydrogenase (NADP+)
MPFEPDKGGMPWEPGVALTPLPEEGKTATLARYVEDAVSKGARVVNAGGAHEASYFQPAVV